MPSAARDDSQSDLVLDSKSDTRFDPGFTVHTYRERSHSSQGRAVQREEYWRRDSQLGGGAYGSAWLEKRVQSHRDVKVRAVKRISTKPLGDGRQLDFGRELEAIAKFSHDKVSLTHSTSLGVNLLKSPKYIHCFVKSFGWYEEDQTLFIAMEYLQHGDLGQYLSTSPPLLEEAAGDLTYQILEGLSFMHNKKFAHRDLKPRVRPSPIKTTKVSD